LNFITIASATTAFYKRKEGLAMKKILSIIMCAMLVFALPCLAVAQTAGAATPEPVQPLDPGDVSWLNTYLDYVIVGICIVIGLLIKHCTPLDNKYIPLIVAVVGLLIAVWSHWGEGITPVVLLGGMFSGLASTGFHQVFKQLFFSDINE
jgi:hypothetical protein